MKIRQYPERETEEGERRITCQYKLNKNAKEEEVEDSELAKSIETGLKMMKMESRDR